MPTDSSPFSVHSGSEPPADFVPGGRGHDSSGIRRQAREIINAVLSDPSPAQAWARDLLREHLAAHPWHPERALAEHLMALRSLNGSPGEAPDPQPEAVPLDEAGAETASRIQAVLDDKLLLTAFQPISDLATGAIRGVEAFTRFVSDGNSTAVWFAEAAEVRMETELELQALTCALTSARNLPTHLYVALKLSPETCLHPQLPELLQTSGLRQDRLVLQLTGALGATDPSVLAAALLPLRRSGIRLAVNHIGSYGGAISHIRQLGPDIIKLDRSLIAGIDTDPHCHAFGAALAQFAGQLGAVLIAEGIETQDELDTVAGLGVSAGQGYFLGRPSARPHDWASWNLPVALVRSRAQRHRVAWSGREG